MDGIVSEGVDAAGDVAKIASGGGKEVIEEVVEESADDVVKAALGGGTGISLRDLMTPEEIARYDAYWNNGLSTLF